MNINLIILLSVFASLSLFSFFLLINSSLEKKENKKSIKPYSKVSPGSHVIRKKHLVVSNKRIVENPPRNYFNQPVKTPASLKIPTASTAEYTPRARFSVVRTREINESINWRGES